MANSHSASDLRVNRVKVLRMVLVLVGLLMICYMEMHSRKYSAALAIPCSPCSCDCVSDTTLASSPIDLFNTSFADCGKDDPETRDEMKKNMIDLLTEEIGLHANVTGDSLERTNVLIMSAKRASSHFQKEAAKCIAAVETCEAAREIARAELIDERKLTALWMSRALGYGWSDGDVNNMNEIL